MSDVITIDQHEEIAVLTFNRESSLNAVSIELAERVTQALIDLDKDPLVKGIVLTGAGSRAFCAGVDLEEGSKVQVADIETWFGTVCNVYRQILLTGKPVIAAVNGIAAGAGFQIALVSDMRVAQPAARFGQPEINAGIPSIMGSYWMTLHLGWSMNQELSLTGRLMDVDEAANLRLVNHVVPLEELIPKACEIAGNLAGKPATAWRRTKARFAEVALRGFDEALRSGVLGQQDAYARGEPKAIMKAFIANRKSRG
ncbi:MAG: enoyl-CoA hydratase/isomerase family protein [Hyphomicrobiaceae bacterium]